jgi:ADP-heptose:LPS heptosyltransferase
VREQSIERAVVIFPGALGDLLLALPALRALRERHHAARLTLVVNAWLGPLVLHAGLADAAAALDDAETATLFAGARLPHWLEGGPVVFSWLGALDDEVRARIARAARRAHFYSVERGAGATHAAVGYARAVGLRATVRSLARAAALVPPSSEAAARLWTGLTPPVLVVHPGAGSRAKRWDPAGFVQVAHWWRTEEGGEVVLVAGPAEGGEAPVVGGVEVREWPLVDLAAVLGRAALYLGNDSGVSHLASAVGAPGVALFGPTDPGRWKPLGNALVALRARAGGPDGITLTALPATRVIAACKRRFTLTRGTPDTSVGSTSSRRIRRSFK